MDSIPMKGQKKSARVLRNSVPWERTTWHSLTNLGNWSLQLAMPWASFEWSAMPHWRTTRTWSSSSLSLSMMCASKTLQMSSDLKERHSKLARCSICLWGCYSSRHRKPLTSYEFSSRTLKVYLTVLNARTSSFSTSWFHLWHSTSLNMFSVVRTRSSRRTIRMPSFPMMALPLVLLTSLKYLTRSMHSPVSTGSSTWMRSSNETQSSSINASSV